MMGSLEQFKGCKDWLKDKGQYIPYPTSWLNQKRWEDEITEKLNTKQDSFLRDMILEMEGKESDKEVRSTKMH